MSTFSTQTVEQVPQWANYLDLANDVKSWLQIPVSDTTRDPVMQDLVDAACYWVQDYLGRPIAPITFFRRFSGWSNGPSPYLMLPYAPVLQIVNVTEWWGFSGPHVLTQQIPENQAGGQQVYQLDALRGKLIRSFMGLMPRPWFGGLGNVEVEWVAGYNPIPPTIRLATRELIKFWWDNTQQTSRSLVPRSEYGGPMEPGVSSLWPGIPDRVRSFLAPFEQVSMG